MLQNRSFEDAPQPVAWALLKPPNADAAWALDASRPLNPDNPHSLRLDIRSTGGGLVGIANSGFKGMPLDGKEATAKAVADWLPRFAQAASKSTDGLHLRAGAEYRLTFYARAAPGWNSPLTATLERTDGTVLATASVAGPGENWGKSTVLLKPSADETDARLVLRARSAGTLWLDMVSLFPQATFEGRENGLRQDLAGMMAALHPAFLRFPGGSFVEGLMLADAYRWKRTIGDPAARPGFQGIWGYRSTDGLGFHEYLQLCEDLGAAPLYVANCGMTEKEFATPEQMRSWVQDAVDAVEYANGPVTSQWGALRAKAGHPAPFGLRYVEIGNENGMDYFWGGGNKAQYRERYLPVYQALKARSPEIITIANCRIDAPMEILDEHYYTRSQSKGLPIRCSRSQGARRVREKSSLKSSTFPARGSPSPSMCGAAPRFVATGQALVLSSADEKDENSFADSIRISPREEPVANVSESFSHTLRPNFVTVLKLRTANGTAPSALR